MKKVNLNTYVEDACFGPSNVRIQTRLSLSNVETLRQLVAISRKDILDMRNIGIKSRAEIENWLSVRGLHLGMTKEEIAEYEGVTAKAEEEKEEVLFIDSKGNVVRLSDNNSNPSEETPPPTEEEVLEKAVEEAFQTQGINLEQEVFWLAKEIFLHDMRKHGYSSHSAAECAASVAVRLYTEVNEKLKKLKE